MGAHNSVVGADQGFRAPSGDQESVHDAVHEDSASAPIAAGQRPRPSFRHPQVRTEERCLDSRFAELIGVPRRTCLARRQIGRGRCHTSSRIEPTMAKLAPSGRREGIARSGRSAATTAGIWPRRRACTAPWRGGICCNLCSTSAERRQLAAARPSSICPATAQIHAGAITLFGNCSCRRFRRIPHTPATVAGLCGVLPYGCMRGMSPWLRLYQIYVPCEPHWVLWRLLSLETRMEPWQQNEEQVGRVPGQEILLRSGLGLSWVKKSAQFSVGSVGVFGLLGRRRGAVSG